MVNEFLQNCKKAYDVLWYNLQGFSWHWFEQAVRLLPDSKKKQLKTAMGDVQYFSTMPNEHVLHMRFNRSSLATRYIENIEGVKSN